MRRCRIRRPVDSSRSKTITTANHTENAEKMALCELYIHAPLGDDADGDGSTTTDVTTTGHTARHTTPTLPTQCFMTDLENIVDPNLWDAECMEYVEHAQDEAQGASHDE